MAEEKKIDSNTTGLRISEEASLGVIDPSPVWYDLEPNTYNDFGGQLALIARNPIDPGRQRKKGVITDLDASGGFNQDVTFKNLSFLWPGLFLSNKTLKFNKLSDGTGSGGPSEIESIGSADEVVFDEDVSALVKTGDLMFFQDFAIAANNGLKSVLSIATDTVTFNETLTAEATAPSGATVLTVGFEFVSGDAAITKVADLLPTLDGSAKDLTELGLVVGEHIFIGGDDNGGTGDAFDALHNNGFSRVALAPTAASITLDKTAGGADGETEMITEAGGTKLIRLFFGSVLKNESAIAPDFNRRTYHIERQLGKPNPVAAPTVVQSELLKGSLFNEASFNIGVADKVNIDLTFIATDNEQRDGVTAGQLLLSTTTGSIASVEEATAYNTSSDFSRIKMAEVRPTQGGSDELAAPIPLFAFITELTLNVNNNASPNKAVGVLGAFDITAGTFEVGGSVTAYFQDVASVKAVRSNADVTLDFVLVKDFGTGALERKTGILLDMPLIALGDGRLNVTQDEAITIPLENNAAEYTPFGHTLMLQEYEFLPDAADL